MFLNLAELCGEDIIYFFSNLGVSCPRPACTSYAIAGDMSTHQSPVSMGVPSLVPVDLCLRPQPHLFVFSADCIALSGETESTTFSRCIPSH